MTTETIILPKDLREFKQAAALVELNAIWQQVRVFALLNADEKISPIKRGIALDAMLNTLNFSKHALSRELGHHRVYKEVGDKIVLG